MGLLGNILSDAISTGVKRGIGNAVGRAVENAVKPAAEKMVEKGAEHINAATESMDKTATELRNSTAAAGDAVNEAAAKTGGFSSLEGALGGLKSRMENYAAEMAKNLKICPECGEACPMDKQFCPSCGAKLPEESAAAAYTCTKCGQVNTPGSKFCDKCGAVLPAAEAEVSSQKAGDEAVLAEFKEKLPQYPAWTTGGRNFELVADGEHDGYPLYRFRADGGESCVEAYTALIIDAGFSRDGGPCSGLFYKEIDGVCYIYDKTDACCDNCFSVTFGVNNVFIKKPEPAKQESIDVASVAKGLFKKLF